MKKNKNGKIKNKLENTIICKAIRKKLKKIEKLKN